MVLKIRGVGADSCSLLNSKCKALGLVHSKGKERKGKERKVKSVSRVRLFVTPWTAASQAPPSMGFSRQEHWSGLPFPSPEGM